MQDQASYVCESCGEEIVVPIDLSAGSSQEYVEDCPVCCCPNVIHIEVDDDEEVRGLGGKGIVSRHDCEWSDQYPTSARHSVMSSISSHTTVLCSLLIVFEFGHVHRGHIKFLRLIVEFSQVFGLEHLPSQDTLLEFFFKFDVDLQFALYRAAIAIDS